VVRVLKTRNQKGDVMPEPDLQKLLKAAPDHSLATLEVDIWASLDRRIGAQRLFKAVFIAQTAVLAAVMIGGAAAGFRLTPAHRPGVLDVFSPRPTLAASTLLGHRKP